MVTSYYIMKMAKNKNMIDKSGDYYEKLQNSKLINFRVSTFLKCRVCLSNGVEPIYGVEYSTDIEEALKSFCSIDINDSDKYPKHLCTICLKFLNKAILFRKVAKNTDKILRKRIKSEPQKDDFFPIPIPCQNETDIDNNHLDTHIEVSKSQNEKDANVQCNTCKKIIRKSYYKTHKTMHDPEHHKYICDICGKTFRLRVGYHNHRLRHGADYPYKCQLCPFKGRYAERLKSHMRTHSGEYRYMCTECPARFLFKGNFNSHVLLKHRNPEYKCDSCSRAFHTKLILQRHHDVEHLGIKSHVCNVCGRAFGYRNTMMKHQRRVHKREKLRFTFKPSED